MTLLEALQKAHQKLNVCTGEMAVDNQNELQGKLILQQVIKQLENGQSLNDLYEGGE